MIDWIENENVKKIIGDFEEEINFIKNKQNNNIVSNKIFIEYLVIKICAVYEECIKIIFKEKIMKKYENINPEPLLKKYNCFDCSKIVELFEIFDVNLDKDFFVDNSNKNNFGEIDDLYRKRQQAAHMLKIDFNNNLPTIKEIIGKYNDSKYFLKKLEEL